MQAQDLYQLYLTNPSIQTDTRKLKQGDIFFALKGPHFNGNEYAARALELGASYAVVDEDILSAEPRVIKVVNVLKALQELALYHRKQFSIPFIAITGSNGKTTTKELVHEVLATKWKTYTTQGNLNNHIGIPLTILKIKKDAQIAVIEMGANHQGEIAEYCMYCLPTHGIITNIGKAHLEGFGGLEGIKKGKGELYDYLRENNGTVFVMWDYDNLREMSTGIKEIFTYGTHDADITGEVRNSDMLLEISITKGINIETIKTQLVGAYNLPNVLAAAAVGHYFKVDANNIKKALENYVPSISRSQLIEMGTNKIVLDAYNANPSSMKAAIENFARMEGGSKVLVLGAMMELGTESLNEHQSIIDTIGGYTWDSVILTGGDYKKLHHPYIYFENSIEAGEWYKQQYFENTLILIKGSRSMQMEKVIE